MRSLSTLWFPERMVDLDSYRLGNTDSGFLPQSYTVVWIVRKMAS